MIHFDHAMAQMHENYVTLPPLIKKNTHPLKKKYSLLKTAFCIIIATALLNISAAYAQAGITWTSRTSAGDNQWGSVTYGNGLYVAVGSAGAVMTSPTGITWTLRTAPTNDWSSVTYGGGVFVAVATSGTNNRAMTSPDGITWTLRTTPADNFWYGVTYGNALFVAVSGAPGVNNRVMTSPNGITWTLRTSAADNQWSDVTYGNGLFVAVAQTGTGNRVMTSPNGITWTIRTSAANSSWNGVTYGNGEFAAVSSAGVMTSPDGITWTSRTSVTNVWTSIVYGVGLFVAVSGGGVTPGVMTSPNGTTWTQRTAATVNQWQAVTYANGLFVAVATTGTGNRVMTSGTFGVVPVKLLSFTGKSKDRSIELQWQTATETNTGHFEIERSKNGSDFYKIGTVASAGNSTVTKSYNFTDAMPLTDANYYRLKQSDLDGKFEYSNIIILNTKGINISVFPNPASNKLTIHTDTDLMNSTAQLYSATGKLEKTIIIKNAAETIDISRLSKGVYTIKFKNGSAVKWVKE